MRETREGILLPYKGRRTSWRVSRGVTRGCTGLPHLRPLCR